MTYPFLTGLRLEVEDPSLLPAGNVLNQIKNPDGALGGWGWITPTVGKMSGYRMPFPAGPSHLEYQTGPAGGPASFHTEPVPVTPGPFYVAGWKTVVGFNAYYYRATLTFLDGAGVEVSHSSTPIFAAGGNDPTLTTAVPAGATQAQLAFDIYGTSAGADLTAQNWIYLRDVRMGPTNSRAKVSLGPQFTNILNSATSITVEREDLNVGTLNASVPDVTYDPSLNALLRPGRRLRLIAGTQTVFTGKLSTAAVKYDPRIAGPKRAQISLTAVDAVADLANVSRPDGVGTIPDLPAVLEGAGVPWRINNSPDQIPPAAPITRNESASVLDQAALTRDSVHGYAWVSREGVFTAWDADQLALLQGDPTATFTETEYGDDIDVSFDVEKVINVVTIKLLRLNTATGETVEVPYGPFYRQSSIDQWGPRSAEFTVHGLADDAATMAAFAEEVFDANATPEIRVNSLTLKAEAPTDVAVRLDLYDKARVTNTGAALDQSPRITKLTHRITPKNWIVELGFERDGGVAAPHITPPLTSGGGASPAAPKQQVGVVASGTFAAGVTKDVPVTFPAEFETAPYVFATVRSSNPHQFSPVTVTDHSTTGCVLHLTRDSATTSINISWLAVV